MGIHSIYAEYVKRTESHDEVICTGPTIDGKIWPKTTKETSACFEFKEKVLKFLFPQAEELGYSWLKYRAAMEELSREGKGDGEEQ